MPDYEFVKYQDLPDDPYTKAIITIKQNLYDKEGHPKPQLLSFGAKDMKTGTRFYAMATHGFTVNGEKKYVKGHMCDSRADQEALDEFVALCARSRGKPLEQSVFEKPRSMDEVVANEQLPF